MNTTLFRARRAFLFVLLLCLLSSWPVRAGEITAADYLALQPKSHFQSGNTLPRLTHWGWSMPYEARIELARDWGYALEFGGRAQLGQIVKAFQDTNNVESRICALAADNPKQFPLAVVLDRNFPKPIPDAFWVRDEQGRFTDGKHAWTEVRGQKAEGGGRKVVSPESPDWYWQRIAEAWAKPLQLIDQRAPIAIVLNGGEYGVGVAGLDQAAWEKDPVVLAARGGQSWFDYISARKAHYENIIAKAVRAAVPDRQLLIYYNTGGESHRTMDEHWKKWAFDSADIRNVSDLPSYECYYRHFNTGWTGGNDALTQFLDSVGYNTALGAPLSYDWVCGGWDRKDGKDDFSDIPHYMGFLKCLYTGGMVGGTAGYFAYPQGGFSAPFPSNDPPQWLQQMVALSRVHALFSHLEPFLRQGYLLPGPMKHKWSADQPAYEFSTGDAGVRALVRKLRNSDHWLVTVWAASGDDRDVEVTIPELGQITFHARACGSVYHLVRSNTKITVTLLDKNGVLPTQDLQEINLDWNQKFGK